ncbi:hypothetical protein MMC34_004010 [Xylographa carneopallida]|nr:hypothetical protein [Xylographa carneopallida]
MSVFSDDFDTITEEELLQAEARCNRAATSVSPYLPHELLLMIFENLEKASLKQVRLVCQRWSRLPLRLLFTRVFLSHYTKDLEVFSQITSRPDMISSVTELVYCTSQFIKDITFELYVDLLFDYPFAIRAIPNSNIDLSNEDRQMNDFILFKQRAPSYSHREQAKSLAVVQRGYEAYKKASEEQVRNRKNGEATIRFCLSLKSLHRLERIRFDHEWLAFSDVERWKLIGFPPSVHHTSPFERSWHQFYIPPTQYLENLGSELSSIMTALTLSPDCSIKFREVKIPDISLDCVATRPLACQYMSDVFQDVRTLVLGTRDEKGETRLRQRVQSGLPRMLCSMPKLKNLHLDADEANRVLVLRDPTVYLSDLLGIPAPIFQHLKLVSLANIVCAQTELLDFLSLQPTLRILILRGIELTEGDWASTFGGFREHLKLRKFFLDWPIYQKDNVELWGRYSAAGKIVCEQIMAFVLHGGDNPLIDSSGTPIFTVEDDQGHSGGNDGGL